MATGNSGFWADFKKFISKGNVVDLAVAVIIGGAFAKIVDSLVTDIVTPVILSPALKAARVDDLKSLSFNGIKYGSFLAAILNFLVIAFSIFLAIQSIEKLQRRLLRKQAVEEAVAPDPAVELQKETADALNRLARAMESRNI